MNDTPTPSSGIERWLARFAAAVVAVSCRAPGAVLIAALAATAAAAWLAATGLALDSDPDRMTSPDLPYRQTQAQIEAAFPGQVDNLVVLIEGSDGNAAWDAARSLATRLRTDTERFSGVFLPGEEDFYRDYGLLYADHAAVAATAERVEGAGPLLGALEQSPQLATFLGALAHLESHGPGLGSLGAPERALVAEVADGIAAIGEGRPASIDWEEAWRGLIGGEPGARQLLLVQPARDFAVFGPALDALQAVRAAAADLPVRVRVTGDVAVLTEEMSMVQGEIIVAAALSLALVCVLLAISLGGRLLAATLVTLLAGLVWTAGFAALTVGRLNVLTIAFAILYIGLGVDFGLHFAIGYLEERQRRGDRIEAALAVTARRVGSSLAFCAITTAIGFFAFLPTAYTGVGELGLISGSGMFLSLVASLTLQPALIQLGAGRIDTPPLLDRLAVSLPSFPLRYPGRVLVVALAAAAAGVAAIPTIRFEADPLDVRDPRVESVQALRDLLSDGEVSPWTAEVLVADREEARRIARELEALPAVRRVFGADDLLPEDADAKAARLARAAEALAPPQGGLDEPRGEAVDPQRALAVTIHALALAVDLDLALSGEEDLEAAAVVDRLLDALDPLVERLDLAVAGAGPVVDVAALDRGLFARIPDAVAGLRSLLTQPAPGFADVPAAVRGRYVAPDGRIRIEVLPAEDLSGPEALERFAAAVQSVRPDAGGAVIATVEFAAAIVRALREALAFALVVIVVLLAVLWRSPRDALLALCPLLLGALMTAALAGVIGLPFNFANVIVLPLILGMGVDSGIHFVHRHRHRQAGDADVLHTGTARAVLLSALTSIGSFTTLAFASHRGVASLAQLLVLGLGAVLIANLVVLPALLTLADRHRDPRRNAEGEHTGAASA